VLDAHVLVLARALPPLLAHAVEDVLRLAGARLRDGSGETSAFGAAS